MFYFVVKRRFGGSIGMCIEIRGGKAGCIHISGSIETLLIAPYASRGQRFVMGFSDGSLIEGWWAPEKRCHAFRVMVEGAGISTVMHRGNGDTVSLEWAIEWATIAPLSSMVLAIGAWHGDRSDDVFTLDGDAKPVAEWLRPHHVRASEEAFLDA